MQTNAKEKYNLTVKTSDITSENYVIDGRFDQVGKSIGQESTFELPKGLYSVKVKVGDEYIEKPVTLTDHQTIHFEPVVFNSPAPLSNTSDTSDFQIETASNCSKKNRADVKKGNGSKLFLFGSVPSETPASNKPLTDADPATGLTLRNFNDDILVDFGRPDVGTHSWQGEPWAACDVELDAGTYVLCVETNNGDTYKQTVITCQGWQTQIFLQPRNYGATEKDVKADLFNSSILMSRIEYGFNPKEISNFRDGTNYRLTEQVRQAMKSRRSVISKELLQTLFSAKFDNPMLGLYAAHLLLQSPDFIFTEVKTVVENLRRLLGASHPDVEALALKMGMGSNFIFHEFPMLAPAWAFVLEAAVNNPKLIPADSLTYKLSGQFWSNEFWLIWGKNKRVETGTLRQELMDILQQEIEKDTPRDFIKGFSQVTRAVGSNKNVTSKIQKYLPSYKKALDNVVSRINADNIIRVTQSLGIPHQKVTDLIKRINLEDLTSAVKKFNIQLPADNDDPQKGKWGGKPKNNFRKITAVVENSKVRGLYNVTIHVVSTKKELPIEGEVKFYLHDTFLNPTPVVVAEAGKATLKLGGVWGSFTVGAELDNGKTQLEIDLSTLPGVPEKFRNS